MTFAFLFEQIVIPRGPIKAKGLLLACIQDKDPCIFFEPKVLYRAAVEDVPVKEYALPLGKADVLIEGKQGHISFWLSGFSCIVCLICWTASPFHLICSEDDNCSVCEMMEPVHSTASITSKAEKAQKWKGKEGLVAV